MFRNNLQRSLPQPYHLTLTSELKDISSYFVYIQPSIYSTYTHLLSANRRSFQVSNFHMLHAMLMQICGRGWGCRVPPHHPPFAFNNCFSYRNIFQNGVDALSKKKTPFDQKLNISSCFGLSDYAQILLGCGLNTYYGVTNKISDFRCQHLQR